MQSILALLALWWFIKRDHKEIVQMLIGAGADVNAQDDVLGIQL